MPRALTMSMGYLEQWDWLMGLSDSETLARDRQRAHRLHKLTLEASREDAEAARPHRLRERDPAVAPSVVRPPLPRDHGAKP